MIKVNDKKQITLMSDKLNKTMMIVTVSNGTRTRTVSRSYGLYSLPSVLTLHSSSVYLYDKSMHGFIKWTNDELKLTFHGVFCCTDSKQVSVLSQRAVCRSSQTQSSDWMTLTMQRLRLDSNPPSTLASSNRFSFFLPSFFKRWGWEFLGCSWSSLSEITSKNR